MLRRRTILKQTIVGDLNTKLLLHLDNNVIDSSPYNVTTSQASGTSFTTGRFNQGFSGTPLIVIGNTAPSSAPDFVGQTYVNTTAPGIVYVAKGLSSVSDWKQTSN